MSAEKEVVNFWLNRKGYFTINNLKRGNKDIGILALKYDKGALAHVMHFELYCSLTGLADHNHIMEKLIDEKFNDNGVIETIKGFTRSVNAGKGIEIENVLVLNSLPKDKEKVVGKLNGKNIKTIEFEKVASEVLNGLSTSYFRNDVIRTMQIVKYLLMHDIKRFVDVLYSCLGHSKRKEFLSELLDRDEIIREFKKTNEERLALILKQAMIKPEKLAEILENEVLNRKTRKPFITSLMEHEKTAKVYKKFEAKKEMSLKKFFE